MGLQVINQGTDVHSVIIDEAYEQVECHRNQDIDARRKLEDKIDDLRLEKDLQEYDFDW